MFKPELKDFRTSLFLYSSRTIVLYLAAIGVTLPPVLLLGFGLKSGGAILSSWITWMLIALFGGVAALNWRKAIEAGRVARVLRDYPRISLYQDRIVLRPAARGLHSHDLWQEYHLPWDKLKRVESITRMAMSVLMLSGEIDSAPRGSTREIDVDYSDIELGCPVNDAADTIWHYRDNAEERRRLPECLG
jgi:hypothetical protein